VEKGWRSLHPQHSYPKAFYSLAINKRCRELSMERIRLFWWMFNTPLHARFAQQLRIGKSSMTIQFVLYSLAIDKRCFNMISLLIRTYGWKPTWESGIIHSEGWKVCHSTIQSSSHLWKQWFDRLRAINSFTLKYLLENCMGRIICQKIVKQWGYHPANQIRSCTVPGSFGCLVDGCLVCVSSMIWIDESRS
jgi:hypothetical protein